MTPELRLVPRPGVAVVWDAASLGSYLDVAEPERAWRLDGELPPGAALRILGAALEDGSLILAAAVREAGANGHADDTIEVLMTGDEDARRAEETLLSTEYDAAGRIRRLGMEIYPEGEDYPVRLAADAAGDSSDRRATMRVRSDGQAGIGLYEIVRAD